MCPQGRGLSVPRRTLTPSPPEEARLGLPQRRRLAPQGLSQGWSRPVSTGAGPGPQGLTRGCRRHTVGPGELLDAGRAARQHPGMGVSLAWKARVRRGQPGPSLTLAIVGTGLGEEL